jgi:hypothetical protein
MLRAGALAWRDQLDHWNSDKRALCLQWSDTQSAALLSST